jgi:hypothetical protein
MHRLFTRLDAIVGLQNAVNGFAGRNRQVEELQHWTVLQILLNGLLTGNPPQAFRGMISNREDFCYHHRMGLFRRMLARPRVAL